MRLLKEACERLAVRFVHGPAGTAASFVREGGTVVGVLAQDGAVHRAGQIVLCMGAWSDALVDFEGQLAGVGVMTAHIQLAEEERVRYATLPVIDCEGMGYFFTPTATGILKACDLSAGRTHYKYEDGRRKSIPVDPRKPVSENVRALGEESVRRLLGATLPELGGKKFADFKAWPVLFSVCPSSY